MVGEVGSIEGAKVDGLGLGAAPTGAREGRPFLPLGVGALVTGLPVVAAADGASVGATVSWTVGSSVGDPEGRHSRYS
mgnify:CR=1 FL=1